MAVQDNGMINKIRLGSPAKSSPTTITTDGGSAPNESATSSAPSAGGLRSKISLSSRADAASAASEPQTTSVPEYDYRSEEPATYDGFDDIDQRISQYDDEFVLTTDQQYQDGFIYDATATATNSMETYETNLQYKNASEGRKKIYKRASIVFLGIFIVSGTLLALMLGTNWLKDKAYTDLSSDMSVPLRENTSTPPVTPSEPSTPTRDWAGLRAENPDIKYWMNVERKPIDYPLVQHETDQNYYLKHDFWGNYSNAGTPFIDVRNFLTDKHLLTYGHHITGSDTMYSTVNKAWDPDEFAEIGKLTLEAPTDTGGTSYEIFYPAFAFMVDQSYQTIQEFEFASDAAFRDWLRGMANEASATNEWTDYLVRNARRSVTFVTCASDTPNQRERTLIIFISVAAPSTSYQDANFLPQDVAEIMAQQQATTTAAATQGSPATQEQAPTETPHVATRLNPIGWLARKIPSPITTTLPCSPLLDGKPYR